jgi:hypothetical protein
LANGIELKTNSLALKRLNGVWNVAVVPNRGKPSNEHHFVTPLALGLTEHELNVGLMAATCAQVQHQGLKRGPWLATQK